MPYLIRKNLGTTGIHLYLLGESRACSAWSQERHKAERFDNEREAQERVAVLGRTEDEEIEVVEETDHHRRPTLT